MLDEEGEGAAVVALGAGLRGHEAHASAEAIINELTDLPQALNPRKLKTYYAENNRVRSEGARNLLRAAREAAVGRMVLQSAAYWYAPVIRGTEVTEDHGLFMDAPDPIGPAVATMKAVEDEVLNEPGLDAVVLRYAMFYGPGTLVQP